MNIKEKFINKNIFRYAHIAYMFMYFMLLTIWSVQQPFNSCPDEQMRYVIPNYIFKNASLPNGLDPSIADPFYGFSYAAQPQLPYIISALIMKIVSLFTENFFALVMAARTTAILSGVINVFVVYKISEMIFLNQIYRYIMVILITLWPQYLFIFTYVNCDGLAALSGSIMLYALINGYKNNWNFKNAFIIAIGISIALLSYLSTYLLVLVCPVAYLIYFVFIAKEHDRWKRFFKYGFFIFGIVAVLSGWQFIMNFIRYDGDIFGMNILDKMGEKYSVYHFSFTENAVAAHKNLYSLKSQIVWCKTMFYSFIGRFGYMNILPSKVLSFVYLAETAVGIFFAVHFVKKIPKVKKENITMLIVIIVYLIMPFAFAYYYSFWCDFQPQGRYAIAAVLPLGIIMTLGFSKIFDFLKSKNNLPLWLACPTVSVISILYCLSLL